MKKLMTILTVLIVGLMGCGRNPVVNVPDIDTPDTDTIIVVDPPSKFLDTKGDGSRP
ncbi:hypothetical protein LCGC14_2493220 [marine sediment metagenome]|uniref:Lipoprotein n=1 Tax=marine sediment metagenome TaxID=412755 RepID=A0A0F9BS16_9ZZZZ